MLCPLSYGRMAQVEGIEPPSSVLEAEVLPLDDTHAWTCRPESNRLIQVLQTLAFPSRPCMKLAPPERFELPT